jgi:hypothetical protein
MALAGRDPELFLCARDRHPKGRDAKGGSVSTAKRATVREADAPNLLRGAALYFKR